MMYTVLNDSKLGTQMNHLEMIKFPKLRKDLFSVRDFTCGTSEKIVDLFTL